MNNKRNIRNSMCKTCEPKSNGPTLRTVITSVTLMHVDGRTFVAYEVNTCSAENVDV